MAYSDTINQTVFTVQKVIDRAFRICKLKPQQITAENQQIARDVLYLALQHLPNRGMQSWTIQSQLVGSPMGQPIVQLNGGVIDVLNANWRTVTRLGGGTASSSAGTAANAFDGDFSTYCDTVAANGNISYNFATATAVTSVGVCFYGTQWLTLQAQVSSDGATWTTVYTQDPANNAVATQYSDSQWIWFDIPQSVAYEYFRIRETSGGILSVRELVFGNAPSEIPFSRLNRDDYNNLPNKYVAGRPAQYWLDRQASAVYMNINPVTDSTNRYGHLSLRIKRQIMDVGNLTAEVEMPPRWYDAICYRLAAELAAELPEVSDNVSTNLEGRARSKELEAQTEDRDNSPIYYQPSIGVYTR